MRAKKMQMACALLLFLGLTLAPLTALAQGSKPVTTDKVNLNTATAEQLETLPGIGPSLAKTIIEYRTKNGKFNKIEEILNVKGMGEKKFQQIKDRLVV